MTPLLVLLASYIVATRVGLLHALDVMLPIAILVWMSLFLLISLKPWPSLQEVK